MKKITLLLALIISAASSFAQTWKIDPAHTKIQFTTKYLLISDVEGEFKEFEGVITSSKDDWSDLRADIVVQAKSINTENEMRDNHLRSDDFFNVEKFPTITFKSRGVKKLDNNKFIITGDLTIRDVTKTVSFPLVYGGTVKDPWGNTKAGFKATGKIDRKDYNLKYSNAAATGEAVVADEVEFTINVILIKS